MEIRVLDSSVCTLKLAFQLQDTKAGEPIGSVCVSLPLVYCMVPLYKKMRLLTYVFKSVLHGVKEQLTHKNFGKFGFKPVT